MKVIAPTVPAELRELAFNIAMGLALVDLDASPAEDALVGILYEGLSLGADRAEAVAAEVRQAFAS